MNIVILKHTENGHQYLFEVPIGKKLKKGDKVLVENRKGFHDATCSCDSFEIDEDGVSALQQNFGGNTSLAKVVGKYNLERWDEGAKTD